MWVRPRIPLPKTWTWVDGAVLLGLCAGLYGLVVAARQWTVPMRPAVNIDLSPWALPRYTLYSFIRGVAAYGLSLGFTLVYGYIAAYRRRAERVMTPLLDILQSIPVLGFMPGLVIALVALFPRSNIGLELAAVIMIFTGQVWNMTFSWYRSLRGIPQDLRDTARVYRFDWWQRLGRLELPYGAIPLVWNSIMSMAGGWFFLMVTEAFVLGHRDFRLPGIGAYMSVAVSEGNLPAICYGVLAMFLMIIVIDQCVWRPIVVWAEKFKVEDIEAQEVPRSFVLEWLRGSALLPWVGAQIGRPLGRALSRWVQRFRHRSKPQAGPGVITPMSVIGWGVVCGMLLATGYGAWRLALLLWQLTGLDWWHVLTGAGATFLRTTLAVFFASLWMIPIGIAIGFSPRLSRVLQPVVQILASFPAPMLFPLVVGLWLHAGGTLETGAVLLMLLGVQWYILFNAIAGATAIPYDLRETTSLYRLRGWARWRVLLFPGMFPALITGWITALGGAWNASIVAEYVQFGGRTFTATGLGSLISVAADQGRFGVLTASVLTMALIVVGINRVVWKRLSSLAEERFSLN